ncbi:recombinase family protein [Acetobacter sp. DsW_063]|uniref:recombinase family protein n=1 Tax=Acetobacter sp. DsW_063 TaxID=1514894 RepID=UPI000A3B7680|nr:recombinase family protein [Acetobacter sp. DsW_063]OUJ14711.1 resolvase [Acetobacter sp. DsW_063]
MADGRFIAYYRVSTDRQGRSGLGLDAQRKAVTDYLNGGSWSLVGEFTDVESGKNNDRPELAKAIELSRLTGARLIIAKLDRLSRNAAFLINMRDAGVQFIAADMPEANAFTVGIMALVAQQEREAISARTKAALAAAKERGTALGGWRGGPKVDSALGRETQVSKADAFAARVMPVIREMQGQGMSLRAIAAGLTERGIMTARGGAWSAASVRNVLSRL